MYNKQIVCFGIKNAYSPRHARFWFLVRSFLCGLGRWPDWVGGGSLMMPILNAPLDSVDWSLLGLLLTGSLPGIWLGSRLLHKTPERVIRSILSVLLAWAGSKLVFA